MKAVAETIRKIQRIFESKQVTEGAGVRLKRALGYDRGSTLDPFLLLDYFNSSDPRDYSAGFPYHPHRGMETVTYVLKGRIEHADSIGSRGSIGPGDVQWMTAGSGIIHQEMPVVSEEGVQGMQLWVNLPAADKMMRPRYREVKKENIGIYRPGKGIEVKVIAGNVGGTDGAVRDLIIDVEYLDVTMGPNTALRHGVKRGNTVFAFILEGNALFGEGDVQKIEKEHTVVFGDGNEIVVRSADDGVRFLLISGKPINEPLAWRGPVVMNTQEELEQAFRELRDGTFVKHGPTT